jgi:DNA-binding MarR family transcriptional regulator
MKTSWRQKLSNEQIATIFFLRQRGYSKAIIAKTVKAHCGVALSTTYYHLDRIEAAETMAFRQTIIEYIQRGYTTGQLAEMWDIELAVINRAYAGKRLN